MGLLAKDNAFLLTSSAELQRQASLRRRRLWKKAEHYLSNHTDFAFTRDDLDEYRQRLFSMRNKEALKTKEESLKSFVQGAVPLMSEDDVRYWQTLISELFVLTLFTYNYHRVLERKQLYQFYEEKLNRYKRYLELLQVKLADGDLEQSLFVSANQVGWSPVFYLGFSLGRWYVDQYEEMRRSPTVATTSWLNELNWHRLYWVWAGGNGGLLGSLFDLEWIKTHCKGHERASKNLAIPVAFLGYVSWILYYFRFSIEFFKLIKHTVSNPWMSEAEANMPWQERLKGQWDQRKFAMLNDLVWATVNLVTIYWLTNSVSLMMGAYGGLLTIGLMCFDVSIAMWQRQEEREAHERECERIRAKQDLFQGQLTSLLEMHELKSIRELILRRAYLRAVKKHQELAEQLAQNRTDIKLQQAVKAARETLTTFSAEVTSSTMDLKTCEKGLTFYRKQLILDEEEAVVELNWKYQNKLLNANVTFAAIFVLAMALMYTPIFPVLIPALAFSSQFGAYGVFVGCLFAVGVTAGQTVYEANLEQDKAREKIDAIIEKKKHLESTWFQVEDLDDRRMALLEYKRLYADLHYQQALIKHEGIKKVFSATTQVIFPAFVFGALFLTTPWMIASVVAFGLVALAIKAYISGLEPTAIDNDKIVLTEEEYQTPDCQKIQAEFNQLIEDIEADRADVDAEVDVAPESETLGRKAAITGIERYGLFSVSAKDKGATGPTVSNESHIAAEEVLLVS